MTTIHGSVRGIHVGPTGVTRLYVRVRGIAESTPDSTIYIERDVDANIGDDVTFVIGAAAIANAAPREDAK